MADKPDVYVGVQVEINQQIVDLMPRTPLNQINDRGLELELAKPLKIGSLGQAFYKIAKEDLGVSEDSLKFLQKDNTSPTGITFIDKVIAKARDAEVTIRALYYKQYPKETTAAYFVNNPDQKAKAGQTDYLFGVSAECQISEGQKGEFFKFKGLFVVIAKGIEDKKVTRVLEESIKALPRSNNSALLGSNDSALPGSNDSASSSQSQP